MSPAKLAVVAVLATMVAHEPRLTKNPAETNPVLLVQSKTPEQLGVGKLLVASRNLGDPNFAATVVLLIHYDADGVVGLILNRRTELPLSRVLEGNKAAKDVSNPVYLGGPVDPHSVMALLKSSAKLDGTQQISNGVGLVVSKDLLDQRLSSRPSPNGLHVYLGYAGWNQDQLKKEMALGAWFVFPADAATVFNPDPDSVWPKMIHQTEQQFARR